MPKKDDASVPETYRSDGRRRCKVFRRGRQCGALAMEAQEVCYSHGGAAPQSRAKAQERIDAAADKAAAHLIKWMNSDKVPYNIRLAAAKDLLDRAHIGTDKSIQVELRKFEVNIEGLLIDVESDPDELARAIGPRNFVPGQVESSSIEFP
jgi:hypothetical protein